MKKKWFVSIQFLMTMILGTPIGLNAQLCEFGETQVVKHQSKVSMGAFKRKKICDHREPVFIAPPCRVIFDYNLVPLTDEGNTSYSADLTAAGSHFLSQKEVEKQFEFAFDLLGKIEDPKLKAEIQAALETKEKQFLKTLVDITSSHQTLKLELDACGRGTFSPVGSELLIEDQVTLQCVGCELTDEVQLRVLLEETIDEIEEQYKRRPDLNVSTEFGLQFTNFVSNFGRLAGNIRWSQWLNRDRPSGTGDFETLVNHREENPSELCERPVHIECRLADSGEEVESGVLANGEQVVCDVERGFVCDNRTQNEGVSCSDYEVRFACPVS